MALRTALLAVLASVVLPASTSAQQQPPGLDAHGTAIRPCSAHSKDQQGIEDFPLDCCSPCDSYHNLVCNDGSTSCDHCRSSAAIEQDTLPEDELVTASQPCFVHPGLQVTESLPCVVDHTITTDNDIAQLPMRNGMLQGWTSLSYRLQGDQFDSRLDTPKLRKKANHLKEEFYTSTSLPLVTPDNHAQFMAVHRRWSFLTGKPLRWNFWELYSGTARASRACYDASLAVGCPADARYGWNLHVPVHRAMLTTTLQLFAVDVLLTAPISPIRVHSVGVLAEVVRELD